MKRVCHQTYSAYAPIYTSISFTYRGYTIMNVSNKIMYLLFGMMAACLVAFLYAVYHIQPRVVVSDTPCVVEDSTETPTATPTAMLKKVVAPSKR